MPEVESGALEESDVIASLQASIDRITGRQSRPEVGLASSGVGQSRPEVEPASSPAEPAATSDDPEYRRAKKCALNILSVRDHSVAELRNKLEAKEHSEDAIELVVAKLERAGLLNDEAYAQNYVRVHRDKRHLSQAALRRELEKKGIGETHIRAAVDSVADEHEIAFGVAMKKARSTVGLPRETRMRRILGMLARRGFPHGISMDVTRRALDEV